MKKELFSFKNLLKFILIILFLLSISFVVQYNIREYDNKNYNDSVIEESFSFLNDSTSLELKETNELENQEKVLNEINQKLKEENYTIDNPLIIVNPYSINPLSAILAFNTDSEESINVSINNEYIFTANSELSHIINIFYLKANETNTIKLNEHEITIDINYDYNELNNSNDLLYVLNDKLYIYKSSKLIGLIDKSIDNYYVLSNGNIMLLSESILYEITPYGYITNIIHINEKVIDFTENNNYLFIITSNNSLIKLNIDNKEKQEININSILNNESGKLSSIDYNNDKIIIGINNINSIIFLNNNLELLYIYGEKMNELNDYYLKTNYYTKPVDNITSLKYKDSYLYVIDNNSLKIFIVNESNKTIRLYKRINNINTSNITYEDKLILNNNEYNTYYRVTNTLNIDSKKSIIKGSILPTYKDTTIYFENTNIESKSISQFELKDYTSSELKESNIVFTNNKLIVNDSYLDEDEVSIILLDKKGFSYEYKIKEKNKSSLNYIDISTLNDSKYFIYTKINSKVYNINRYVSKRSI